jgi:hypothetical protein
MRLKRWQSGLLAIGVLAAGLFAWQRQTGGPDDAPAAQAPAASPWPSSPPAQVAANIPAQSQALPPPLDEAPLDEAPLNEAPLNVQIERLLATHDPADAYRAYRLVADCAAFNLNHDRIIFDEDDILKNWKGDTMPGFRAMTEDEKRHDARLCSGLTERERQSRLDYLAIAAKAGVPGAAVSFAIEGPFGDPSALETRPGDPLVQAWKATAISQLTHAAEDEADLNAIRYLADQYDNGSALTGRNPLLAYRYRAAASLVTESVLGPGNPILKNLVSQREGLAANLQDASLEQRAAELAAARRIADLVKAKRRSATQSG